MLDKTKNSGAAHSSIDVQQQTSRAASELPQPKRGLKPRQSSGGASPIAAARKPTLVSKVVNRPQQPNRRAHLLNEVQEAYSPATDYGDVGAQICVEPQLNASPDIAVIINLWRQYEAWLRARMRLELQAQAQCRRRCDGDKEAAAKLWKQVQQGGVGAHECAEIQVVRSPDIALLIVLEPFIATIAQWNEKLKPVRTQLEKLAAQTRYYKLIPKGFGAFNLAGLLGECGEITDYRNPSCLWKRMGLAVIDGERQRKCADADKALIHGYNPRRRALAYIIGDCLIKSNSVPKAVYNERKAKKIADGWSKIHAHCDAKMFMVKRVLRDLWIASQPTKPLTSTLQNGGKQLETDLKECHGPFRNKS